MQMLNVLGYLRQLGYLSQFRYTFYEFSEHNNVNIPFTQAVPNRWKHNHCKC